MQRFERDQSVFQVMKIQSSSLYSYLIPNYQSNSRDF